MMSILGLIGLLMIGGFYVPEGEWIEWKGVEVTGYCPCEKCCGEWADGLTASGKPAKYPLIAGPKWMKFGTVIKVKGYPLSRVEDRGGVIKGSRLDLLFDTHEEALKWGRVSVRVWVWVEKGR